MTLVTVLFWNDKTGQYDGHAMPCIGTYVDEIWERSPEGNEKHICDYARGLVFLDPYAKDPVNAVTEMETGVKVGANGATEWQSTTTRYNGQVVVGVVFN
jgi:hypothetical protein